MTAAAGGRDVSSLLAEQVAFYRAVAPDYEQHAIRGAWGGEPEAALEAFAPAGAVLELACGPATRVSASARAPFYWGAGGRA